MFDFFYGNESEQYMFYRVPQVLFTDERFKSISCEAKLLYGFLLDRTSLSVKNKWVDKAGMAYVYYKQETAQENLNIGKDKALKIFAELEKIGLIIRKKQGQGNPTRIYVMNFAKPVKDDDKDIIHKILSFSKSKSKTSASGDKQKIQTSEKPKSENNKQKSRPLKNRSQEVEKKEFLTSEKSTYIHTELNHTENNNINPSINNVSERQLKTEPKSETVIIDRLIDGNSPSYQDCVAKAQFQISYHPLLSQQKNKSYLDLIVSLMADVYAHRTDKSGTVNINGVQISISDVACRFELLDDSHIEYVLDKIIDVTKTKKIKNILSYVRSCLFNAPVTMEFDTDAQVNYDLENYNK